jgi:hypothetical protein
LNFVLNRWHFLDELPFFVQFLLGFGKRLIPVWKLLLQDLVFIMQRLLLKRSQIIIVV